MGKGDYQLVSTDQNKDGHSEKRINVTEIIGFQTIKMLGRKSSRSKILSQLCELYRIRLSIICNYGDTHASIYEGEQQQRQLLTDSLFLCLSNQQI